MLLLIFKALFLALAGWLFVVLIALLMTMLELRAHCLRALSQTILEKRVSVLHAYSCNLC